MWLNYNPIDLNENLKKLDNDILSNSDIKKSVDVALNMTNIKSTIKFNGNETIITVPDYEKFSEVFGLYVDDKKLDRCW